MRKLRTILQYRYTIKILTIFILIGAIIFININNRTSKYSGNENNIIGKVTDYKIDGDKLTIELKSKEKIIINYIFKSEEEKNYYIEYLLLGDTLKIEGTLEIPSNNTIPNTFNYKKYLENKSIYYIMYANKLTIVEKNKSIFYELKNLLIKRIDRIDKTGYLRLLILGDKQYLTEDIYSLYQENGISHLFAISGMHISVLLGIIFLLLDKITFNNYIKYTIVSIFLLYYLFLTKATASILRVTIMFFINILNTILQLKLKKIDIVLLTLDVIILINPYIILDMGFQFSYIISLYLTLYNKKIMSISSKIKRSIYLSGICFLVSFPISIYYFYQVNILSILYNIIYIPFVSIILLPLCILVLFFPFLESILQIIVNILESTNIILSNITILKIVFAKPYIIIVFIYYILIYLMIDKKKYIKYLLIFMIIHKNIIYFNPNMKVMILDVSQGDSILIKLPFNKGNILIDTGGISSYEKEDWQIRNKNYSIVKDKTIPYLKSLGINKIDLLISTHGDNDHIGESINLVNNFKVDKVIFNCGEYQNHEKELIEVLNNKNIKYHSCIKELSIDKYKLYFLNTKEYDNENDNSNVIYFNYNNYKFLFMGDAGIEKEKDIIEKYNLKDIDFLKVGHHGSNTSSSKYFIETINPKYSLISVGKNNIYGHPKESVLDTLSNSKIYRTDKNGSIEIEINKDRYKIRTYSP